MEQTNENSGFRAKSALLLLCLLMVGALALGVTYGRYRQEYPTASYKFIADGAGSLTLGGVITQDWVDMGLWPEMPAEWTVTGNRGQIEFSIRNCQTGDSYTRRSQAATVRLVAGLGIGAPENLTVTLSYPQSNETVTLTARAEAIGEGSLLHKTYGEGWVYCFYDDMGNEKTFSLPGGQLSYQNLRMTLEGEIDPILCQLQVTGKYTDE